MIYAFDHFELDTGAVEIRAHGAPVHVEPQVYALLLHLIAHRDRMVSKDEIVEHIWNGRIVSDSAVASRIKSLRQALGDDGRTQRYVRTVHGAGFRFVAAVSVTDAARVLDTAQETPTPPESARPSIAVLPFRVLGGDADYAVIGDALPYELITELSKLRWLFVIARGSTFQFRGAEIEKVRAGLGVRYCLAGDVEFAAGKMIVSVELVDTRDKGVVWAERFEGKVGDVHEMRERIVRAIITALELQITLNEARHARAIPAAQLDAWAVYHLGVQHMYRFTKADNALAAGLFERALTMAPDFNRAHAGLSFTHFQDAFLRYNDNTGQSADLARKHAERALEHDPIDPFSNFVMGRVSWLAGDLEASLPWLDRANMLNPNFAQARYARGWTDALLGHGDDGQHHVDAALALSPLDPLRYGMQATRAFAHIVRGEQQEAAHWAASAARSPGAHVLIDMIAAAMHALNGDEAEAIYWARRARSRNASITAADFFRAFPFQGEAIRNRMAAALAKLGF